MSTCTRRDFLLAASAAATAAALPRTSSGQQPPPAGVRAPSGSPVVVSSANGLRATEKAAELIRSGSDTLDAVVAGVNIVEEDPNDNSVG